MNHIGPEDDPDYAEKMARAMSATQEEDEDGVPIVSITLGLPAIIWKSIVREERVGIVLQRMSVVYLWIGAAVAASFVVYPNRFASAALAGSLIVIGGVALKGLRMREKRFKAIRSNVPTFLGGADSPPPEGIAAMLDTALAAAADRLECPECHATGFDSTRHGDHAHFQCRGCGKMMAVPMPDGPWNT